MKSYSKLKPNQTNKPGKFLPNPCMYMSCPVGVDTDEVENLGEEEYDEEVVEFLLKVEEIILDEE